MTTKTILRTVALLLTFILLFSLVGCAANSELRANMRADNTVATVGDYEIPYETLYYLTMNQISDMKLIYGENVFDDPARVEELKSFVAENLFSYTDAMILVGREYGIEVEDSDIQDKVQTTVDNLISIDLEGDRSAYIDLLEMYYMTDHYFRTSIAVSEYMTDAILNKMLISGEIDDSDAAARERIYGGSVIHVYQVYIDPNQPQFKSKEQAKDLAEQLRESVAGEQDTQKRLSAMFKAKQYSLDTDTRDGLYIAKGEMDRAFEAVAFDLVEHEVSPVAYINGGYCFLMRAPLDDAYIDSHFEELKQKSYYVSLNQKAEAYIDSALVEWTEYGAELDLLDLPVLEADGGEWLDTVIAACIVGGVVLFIALLVKFMPDKDKKRKAKGKAGVTAANGKK